VGFGRLPEELDIEPRRVVPLFLQASPPLGERAPALREGRFVAGNHVSPGRSVGTERYGTRQIGDARAAVRARGEVPHERPVRVRERKQEFLQGVVIRVDLHARSPSASGGSSR
jgi:hypothetical protein